ncbi:MAG: phosphotransferase [Thiolinea sp.]
MINPQPHPDNPRLIVSSVQALDIDWIKSLLMQTPQAAAAESLASFRVEPLLEDAGNSLGQLYRLRLAYHAKHMDWPQTLVVKLASQYESVREALKMAGLYPREVRFYSQWAGKTGIATAPCHYAALDEVSGDLIIVLDDLSELEETALHQGCSLPQVEAVLESLATLHAQWWEHDFGNTDFPAPYNGNLSFWQGVCSPWLAGLPQHVERLCPDWLEHLPALEPWTTHLCRDLPDIYTRLAQAPCTLLHQDAHSENIRFARTGTSLTPYFLDWQFVGYGRAGTDPSYFLISSVPPERLAHHEESWLDFYHQRLVQKGVNNYDLAACRKDYLDAFFRLLMILVAIPHVSDMTREANRLFFETFLQRALAFARRHQPSGD